MLKIKCSALMLFRCSPRPKTRRPDAAVMPWRFHLPGAVAGFAPVRLTSNRPETEVGATSQFKGAEARPPRALPRT